MTGIAGGGGGGGGGGYDYVQNATPSGAVEGEEWYDTGANAAYVYDGASWIEQTVTDHGQLSGVTASDHHSPISETSVAHQLLDQNEQTSGTHQSLSVPGFHFEAAWLKVHEQSAGGTDQTTCNTRMELVFGDGTTQTFTASQKWTGGDGGNTAIWVHPNDITSRSYVTSGLDTINLKWDNNLNDEDSGATSSADHYWEVRGWQQP